MRRPPAAAWLVALTLLTLGAEPAPTQARGGHGTSLAGPSPSQRYGFALGTLLDGWHQASYPGGPPAEALRGTIFGRLPLGLVGGSDFREPETADLYERLGGESLRVEFEVESDPEDLREVFAGFGARDIRLLVLAGFYQRLPDARAVERFCSGVAGRYGPRGSAGLPDDLAVRHIEFGNETSYAYMDATFRQPERYARLLAICARAARAANQEVGVMAIADDPTGIGWVGRMFDAVPDLDALVAGWVSHPYGPPPRADRMLDQVRDQTAAQGSSKPIFATEWGLATDDGAALTDNYDWPVDMTYRDAARALVGTLGRWRTKYPRLAGVWYYQARDQRAPRTTDERERYFGLVQSDAEPKPTLTATARDLLRWGAIPPE